MSTRAADRIAIVGASLTLLIVIVFLLVRVEQQGREIEKLRVFACGFYQYEDYSVDTESSDKARWYCVYGKAEGYFAD